MFGKIFHTTDGAKHLCFLYSVKSIVCISWNHSTVRIYITFVTFVTKPRCTNWSVLNPAWLQIMLKNICMGCQPWRNQPTTDWIWIKSSDTNARFYHLPMMLVLILLLNEELLMSICLLQLCQGPCWNLVIISFGGYLNYFAVLNVAQSKFIEAFFIQVCSN